MKRVFSLLLTAALLAAVLTGCSAPAEEPAPEVTEAPAEEPAELPAEEAGEEPAPAEAAEVRIGALTGPTAMGLVKLLDDAAQGQTVNSYVPTVCGSPDELRPLLLQGELDIAAVPSNMASVLYNKTGGQLQALAVNTLGVLYIVEKGGDSVQSLADLAGKAVYATGKGSVPEYFLRYLLAQNGLDADSDLTVEWKSEPNEVVALMSTMDNAVAMLPQPFVTVAQTKLGEGLRVAVSLTEEWDALENGSRCTTACLVVNRDFAEANPRAVAQFLEEFEASVAWVNENPAEAAPLCESFGIVKAPVAEKAIPYCSLVSITGPEMKEALSGCLSVLFELNPAAVGGTLPGDDFYYGA